MIQLDPVLVTKDLIQIESSDPGVFEGSVASYIYNYLQNIPCTNLKVTEENVVDGRKNIMAVLPCTSNLPDLVFICHMDTVPIGNDWTMPPLEALEQNQHIYGRGACDMKSGLSCALTAFANAALQIASGVIPTCTLRFIATVDEEDIMRGVEKALASGWIPANSFILDTEPTSLNILTGHKGRLWFHLTVHGKAAHASNPAEGADAIEGMAEVVSYIRTHITDFPQDSFFGASTVCFGQISGGTSPYAVSDSCSVTIDMRLVPPADKKRAIELIEAAGNYARSQIPGIHITYDITGDRMPIPYYPDSELLAHLSKACHTTLQRQPKISVFTGYTDSAVASGILQNKNCASFGPGDLKMAHKADEYVPIQDITDCRLVLDELIKEFVFQEE